MSENSKYISENVGEIARIFLRGQTWHVTIQYKGRQIRRSLKTLNKRQARAKALEMERELTEKSLSRLAQLRPVSIEEIANRLIESCETEGRRPRTLEKYRQVLHRLVRFANENCVHELQDFDIDIVDRYRRMRKVDGAQLRTVYTEIGILRRLVSFARSRRLIFENPLKGLKMNKPKGNPQPCWSPTEIEKILENASPVHRSIFSLLSVTGMRIGELRWLT